MKLTLNQVAKNLGSLVRTKRRRKNLSIRKTAAQVGVSHPLVQNVEAGKDIKLSTFLKFVRWLYNNRPPKLPDPRKRWR